MDWQRLGRMVVERRVEMGMPLQQHLAVAAGVTRRLLSDIENGNRDNYDRATLVRLEQALGWQPGSAAAVLDGGQPVLIPGTVGAEDVGDLADEVALIGRAALPEAVKAAMVDYMRGLFERQRAERRQQLQAWIDAAEKGAG